MRTSLVTACAPSLVPKVQVPVWLWASMRPGVMCLPSRSNVRTPRGAPATAPEVTTAILPPSMRSEPFWMTPAGPLVQIVALVKRTVSCGGSSVRAYGPKGYPGSVSGAGGVREDSESLTLGPSEPKLMVQGSGTRKSGRHILG